MKEKLSFFEKLTGGVDVDDEDVDTKETEDENGSHGDSNWIEESSEEGELAIDVHQTDDKIIIKAMIAGVEPDDLDVSITRDMVSIKGSRKEEENIETEDYFYKELYWGTFSRTILLPQEIEPDEAKATEKHGLLILHLPKIDHKKTTKIKIKST